MTLNKLLFLLLLVPLVIEATDLKPWFGTEYETEIRASVLYQNYQSLSIPEHHSFKRSENDAFVTLSAAYPFKQYCGEFEATAAFTRHQNQCWDNFRVTGRYQWMDECEGEPLSVVTGLTITQPFARALHDVSSFHHGHIEGEAHFAFGKKYGYPCSKDYIFRWWSVTGIGVAEVGSPWVRGDAVCEYNYENVYQLRGFVNTLWGIGKDILRPHHFKGYGKIRHKSVDLGLRYGWNFNCWGTLSLQYARRVYACNFPQNTNLVLLEYYFPFGYQATFTY